MSLYTYVEEGGPIMKKVILSILVAVAVLFVVALIQTLIKNMTFT